MAVGGEVPARRIDLSDGRVLTCVEYGESTGRPVVFFHGCPGSRGEGTLLDSRARASGLRLIVPDRPGMGGSDFQRARSLLDWPSDVTELVDSLGLERFAVLGVSGGGPYVIAVEVPTDTVHGRSIPSDPKRSNCRIDLVDLEEKLAIHDGRYHPPTSPAQFLDHARSRLTLAYGRRTSEYPWLLRLQGQYPLLACLVHDPAEIRWTFE